ncbi:MAG: GNAT family N-acetyltransferase [Candidatus Nanopelagicales bacterium]|nr:GNAT family N-acetyltransferase [Candidatus Nanopelagicales bacterium]
MRDVAVLQAQDLEPLLRLFARDPVAHCFVESRVQAGGVDPWQLGGEVLGYFSDGELVSALFAGANLVPIETTPAARSAFADYLRPRVRRASSILGRADEVLDLWRFLEPAWGRARAIRDQQPLMAISGDPIVEPDPGVRRIVIDELDAYLPAAIDMFTEEIGVSPVAGGNVLPYRARVADTIRVGRALGRMHEGSVEFKAEVGSVAPFVCQVQGVWVARHLRGQGLSIPAMAAVVEFARHHFAPTVSLYVNSFNTPARKAYRAVGFDEVGTFATVLF